jgi:hypothetical protein
MVTSMSHLLATSEWVNLRPTVSRPVCPGVRRPSETCDQFLFFLEISFRHLRFCKFVSPSLTRGRVCKLLYNCFWALPEQSLLDRSPAEPTALFYCLIGGSTNLEGQVPVFRSHVSAVRYFQYYYCFVFSLYRYVRAISIATFLTALDLLFIKHDNHVTLLATIYSRANTYYTRPIFTTCFGRDAPSSGEAEYNTSNYKSLLNCNINYNKT